MASDHAATLRAALARLGETDLRLLTMAREMRAIYSVDTMHGHLTAEATRLGVPVCWTRLDLQAFYTENSPEPLLPLPNRLDVPPDETMARISHTLLDAAMPVDDVFEVRDGSLRVRRGFDGGDDIGMWLCELGECAEWVTSDRSGELVPQPSVAVRLL